MEEKKRPWARWLQLIVAAAWAVTGLLRFLDYRRERLSGGILRTLGPQVWERWAAEQMLFGTLNLVTALGFFAVFLAWKLPPKSRENYRMQAGVLACCAALIALSALWVRLGVLSSLARWLWGGAVALCGAGAAWCGIQSIRASYKDNM